MVKIFGYNRSEGKGDVKGVYREWDNYNFHCLIDTNHKVRGLATDIIKVKTDSVLDVFGISSFDELDKFLNKEVILHSTPVGNNHYILEKVTLK